MVTKTRAVFQEREKSAHTNNEVVHSPADDYILNTCQMRNQSLVHAFRPRPKQLNRASVVFQAVKAEIDACKARSKSAAPIDVTRNGPPPFHPSTPARLVHDTSTTHNSLPEPSVDLAGSWALPIPYSLRPPSLVSPRASQSPHGASTSQRPACLEHTGPPTHSVPYSATPPYLASMSLSRLPQRASTTQHWWPTGFVEQTGMAAPTISHSAPPPVLTSILRPLHAASATPRWPPATPFGLVGSSPDPGQSLRWTTLSQPPHEASTSPHWWPAAPVGLAGSSLDPGRSIPPPQPLLPLHDHDMSENSQAAHQLETTNHLQ